MRERRWLHPGAWWLWALGLATAASRTTNPLVLLLLVAAAAMVVAARRPRTPWGHAFSFFLRLGILVIVMRVLLQALLTPAIGTTHVVDLPSLTLPGWLAGVRLGGAVTAESLLAALIDGLRLATIIVCVGAANSLASSARLLKSVPAALYEVGVSIVVALTFAPMLVSDVSRHRDTRRLRGRRTRGPRAIAASAFPVLEGALDRSITLAAAMDARGYGRRGSITRRQHRVASTAMLGGLVATCIGVYGLVSVSAPVALGLPMLILGVVAAAAGAVIASRRTTRTRYRPDPWRLPEWLVAASGALAAVIMVVAAWAGVPGIEFQADPPAWPALPMPAVMAVLISLTPLWAAPRLPAWADPRHVSSTREAVSA